MTNQNISLFDTPVKSKKIRNGIWAHLYRNGVINIMGEKYQGYSMTDAIRHYRRKCKAQTAFFRNTIF